MRYSILASSLFAIGFFGTAALAATDTSTTTVSDCVIHEVLPGRAMTGGFATFEHQGETVEILEALLPSITDHVELHEMSMVDNVMTMGPLQDKSLTEGQRFFRKGGDHVMIMSIPEDKTPQIGETHTMTFKLSNGKSVSCEAIVKSLNEVMKEHAVKKATH
ncbi:Uncharacterized protein conserved in bacteria [Oligella urethralis]|uniref:copper chaperone PCu(A)C n=1 Tax=Oligella urethralis TaxID=90245 RepID=UPI000E055840|nr:copper chaperone PCu(A)C [Oligella urethralis]SUA61193.1 Uncharacterized protein conserved in bacteria [Oligella urethralis]